MGNGDSPEAWQWRGKVDSTLDTQDRRISACFESLHAYREKCDVRIDKIKEDITDLEKLFSAYSAKVTVIVAIASLVGTSLTTALIQIIARSFFHQ